MKKTVEMRAVVEEGFSPPFLRTPYNYDMLAASDESGIACRDPSRAVQESKDESDINTIVKRFGLTGKLPQGVTVPQYGDFEGVTDYHSALNLVLQAEDGFMKMPADIRSRFHNDPAAFLEFVGKEENREEAIKMGLIVPERPVEPILVRVKGEDKAPPSSEPVKGSKEAP